MFLISRREPLSRREPPDAEDLRCEYAAAEAHIANLTSGVWQSAAIIVGGSIAAFAVLINAEFTHAVAGAVTVLALGAVVVIAMWRYNWSRHKVSIDNCWVRMREIERARGMRKNIGLYCFTKGRNEFPEPPGRRVVGCFGRIWHKLTCECLRHLCGNVWQKVEPKLRPLLQLLPRLPHSGQDVLHGTAWLVQVGWLLMIAFAWIEALRC